MVANDHAKENTENATNTRNVKNGIKSVEKNLNYQR